MAISSDGVYSALNMPLKQVRGLRDRFVPFHERRYRIPMVQFPRTFLIPIVTAVLLAACSAPVPQQDGQMNVDVYVYKSGEFNRSSSTFAKDPTNITSVTICYNKSGTKPQIVANMAAKECAKFSKKAEFVSQSLSICPLFTPVAAIYNCIDGN